MMRLWPRIAVAGLGLLTSLTACSPPSETDARERIRDALHLPAGSPAPLAARVDDTWHRREAVVERVVFHGHHGQPIPALVSYSELAYTRPLPVVLWMPGSPNRKEDLVQPRQLLPAWAQAGFFVLSIDRPYHGDRPGDPEDAIRTKGLPAVLGEYVQDLRRALDYVETRPEADASRIGMMGLSMGGMEALLLAAVDDRVTCVTSVAGQLSWRDVFTSQTWKLIFTGLPLTERLRREGASGRTVHDAFLEAMPELEILDAPSIAATLSPRPLLLMTGDADPYVTATAARRTHAAARAAYGELADERLQLWIEKGVGHAFSVEMERRARAWFTRWLGAANASVR